jgi:archaemetzincin
MPISRRRALAGLACLPCCACKRDPHDPPRPAPAPATWRDQLGPLDDLGPAIRSAFTDADDFTPLPPPGPDSWRTLRPEPAQSVPDFLASAPNQRRSPRDRLALLPLGRFPHDFLVGADLVTLVRSPPIAVLAAVLAASFATPVDRLASAPFPEAALPWRPVSSFHQYDARALLNHVAARLPGTAHAMLTLVNVDLHVFADQQYTFGWSTLDERLGVVSFARFDPSVHGGPAPDDVPGTLLRRALRVTIHEVGHLFGLGHCQAFRCVMNGMADLAEVDATPLHMCPLCLRKLHHVARFDPRARDHELQRLYTAVGLSDEAAWLGRRLARLTRRA